MIEIKDLLLKFRGILSSEESKKDVIVDIIKKNSGVEVLREKLDLKNGVLYLNVKHIYKNEIFMKKEKILLELEKSIGKKAPREIR